jgi:hypothetical protein
LVPRAEIPEGAQFCIVDISETGEVGLVGTREGYRESMLLACRCCSGCCKGW